MKIEFTSSRARWSALGEQLSFYGDGNERSGASQDLQDGGAKAKTFQGPFVWSKVHSVQTVPCTENWTFHVPRCFKIYIENG